MLFTVFIIHSVRSPKQLIRSTLAGREVEREIIVKNNTIDVTYYTLLVVTHSDDEVIFASQVLENRRGRVLVLCLTCGNSEAVGRSNSGKVITAHWRRENFISAVESTSNIPIVWSFTDQWGGFAEGEPSEIEVRLRVLLSNFTKNGTSIQHIISHGPHGEYGHAEHKQCYTIVNRVAAAEKVQHLSFFAKGKILSDKKLERKRELWVLHEAQDHILNRVKIADWFKHESLCEFEKSCCVVRHPNIEWSESVAVNKTNSNNQSSMFKKILLEEKNISHAAQTAHKICPWCLPIHGNLGNKLSWLVDGSGWKFEDRRILNTYLEHFAAQELKTVLWVGCFPGSTFVNYVFPESVNFFTIEPNPDMKEYGAPGRHIIDVVQNITKYEELIPSSSIDLVLLHGVVGRGIDTREEIGSAAKALHEVMKPGGLMYLWRNTHSPGDHRREEKYGNCGDSIALNDFAPYFKPLKRLDQTNVPLKLAHQKVTTGVFDLLYHTCAFSDKQASISA